MSIPKIIHQIWWQGEKSIPEKYLSYIESWKTNHPDFKYMFWDEKKELIFTNKKVTITTDKEVIYGEGLTSNLDFSVYTLKKVHGKINYLATENKN